jgi:hypothetical protein
MWVLRQLWACRSFLKLTRFNNPGVDYRAGGKSGGVERKMYNRYTDD